MGVYYSNSKYFHPKRLFQRRTYNTNNTTNLQENTIKQFTEEQIELLKTCFTSAFKGMGNNINYFDENLLLDLKPTQPPQLHFTRYFTDTERQNLFNGLVSGGFIPKDTNINNFNFVFGGAETTDFKQLQWDASVALLAYFINKICKLTDKTNIWKITENCFTINSKKPNINTLKSTRYNFMDGYKNHPKGSDKIDDIMKNL